MTSPAAEEPGAVPGQGITRLLGAFSHGDPGEILALDGLLQGLGRSAFGMFLFVSVLPGFVPIPGFAGVVSGPLVVLIGLQLMAGLRKPWLPRAIGRRGPRRATMARFCERITPSMARLEHLVRPRLQALTSNRLANLLTGALLIGLGLLLALPLPMTNFVFAGALLLFALALIERDGVLLGVLWLVSGAGLVATGLLSQELARLVQGWFA